MVKERETQTDDEQAEPKGEESKNTVLYLYDDTDATWEKEQFAGMLLTTLRMGGKRLIKDPTLSYRTADGTLRELTTEELSKGITVVKDTPGEFIMEALISPGQLLPTGTDEENPMPADRVRINADALREFLGANKEDAEALLEQYDGNLEQFLEEHGEEAKQFLEDHGEEAKAFLEDHGDEVKQFIEDHGEETKQFLEEHGGEAKQLLLDAKYLAELLSSQEMLKIQAAFDPISGELNYLALFVPQQEGQKETEIKKGFRLRDFSVKMIYSGHEDMSVSLPQEITDTAEEKESGMILHRMIEELELLK